MALNINKRKALNSFSFLWRVNDSDWANERKSQWRELQNSVYRDCEIDEIRENRDYFLTGKLDTYIPEITIYFLTPLENKAQSDDFFLVMFLPIEIEHVSQGLPTLKVSIILKITILCVGM